jgi:hypothetical protein
MNNNFAILTVFSLLSYAFAYAFAYAFTSTDNKIVVSDYTLNQQITIIIPDNTIIFSLDKYNTKDTKIKEWISYFVDDTLSRKEKVDSLNQIIINATDTLLQMCNRMIEKTTSVLPLSYSYKMTTDIEFYSDKEKKEGFISYFSSSTQVIGTQLKDQIEMDLYAYHEYREAVNIRKSFLNSLCDNTFEDPHTLFYDSENNTISFTYDPNKIKYYIIIIQNIIDNSHIRNLNRGFKEKKEKMSKNEGYNGIRFDIDLDIDKDKTKSLVEKAKYILPILQKFERQMPNYLELTGKRSLTLDDYFTNLNHFWEDVLEQAKIGAHDSPFEFKKELSEKEALRAKHEAELLEKELKRLDINKKAELEANQIVQEFRNKQRIEDAHNYVREQKIMQDDKKYNYSNIEWSQYKNKIKQRVTDFTDVFVYGINGLLKSPADFIVNFTSETIFEIGKVAFMLFILISICSYIWKKIVSIF